MLKIQMTQYSIKSIKKNAHLNPFDKWRTPQKSLVYSSLACNSFNFLCPALETDFHYREAIAEACSSLSSAHLLLRNQEPDLYLHLWHGSYVWNLKDVESRSKQSAPV